MSSWALAVQVVRVLPLFFFPKSPAGKATPLHSGAEHG